MKKMMLSYIVLLLIVTCVTINAAYYVTDPNNCPTEYQSQTCSGSDVVCGYNGGITYCYDPTNINAPTVTHTSNTDYTCSDATCNGGHIIDCYYYDGTEPHCDNDNTGWCDRNSTCYTSWHRITTCSANVFATSTCGACNSGYRECDGGNDACEVVDNAVCEANSHFDADDACFGSYGNCDCNSGYDDCNNDDGDSNQETGQYTSDGCEIDEWTTDYPTGANNRYNDNCQCVCDSNYEDCDASGCDAGTGCEYHYNVACGTNAQNLSGCAGCTCNSGYYFCDGAPDDGDGCEVNDGGSCTVGSLSGTWDCSVGSGGCYTVDGGTQYSCTCVVDKSYFETGTNVEYQTNESQAFLWGTDYNLGDLINISWSVGGGFYVNATGAYFNGTLLGTGGSNCEADQSCANILYESDLPLNQKTTIHWDNITAGKPSGLDDGDNDTTYTNGSGISLVGTEFNHSDTSSQSSEDNSGNTFIQDIILDNFGHITGLVSTAVDFANYYLKSEVYNQTETENYFVNRTDWTTIDNYPSSCSAGDFVTGLADTLSCSTPSYIGNCSNDQSCTNILYNSDLPLANQTTIDWENITSGWRLDVAWNGELGWQNLTDYPSACSAGKAVTQIADTLICSAFQTGSELWNTTEEMQDACGAMAGSHLTYTDASNDLSVDDDWWNAYADFMGTTTTGKICRWDGLEIDCDYTDQDTNLTEDDVEAYIFDDDNTANLNMSNYNITFTGSNKIYVDGSGCLRIVSSTSTIRVC